MGHIVNADGTLTIQSTPTQTVADMQAIADRAETIGGLLKGTAADRGNLTPGQAKEGWLFSETDTGRVYQLRSGNWERFAGFSRGLFVGGTNAGGVATVNHGLGVVPGAVVVTDRNAGAVPGSRKVVFVTATATQIQFVVYNTALVSGALSTAPLPNNPVEFYWTAFL